MSKSVFTQDIAKLRDKALAQLDNHDNINYSGFDVDDVVGMLNISLATEMICSLRYKSHYYKAKELGANLAAKEFLEHSIQEQQHADKLADRISQLGKSPELNPEKIIGSSHLDYVVCNNLNEMIKENLMAEKIAIEVYRSNIIKLGEQDPTTRRVLEDILAVEEEHADDLLELKYEYDITF